MREVFDGFVANCQPEIICDLGCFNTSSRAFNRMSIPIFHKTGDRAFVRGRTRKETFLIGGL
jgi:hypothetical protein